MASRYYLVDLGTNPGQRAQRVNTLRSMLPNGPTRQATQDMLHWVESTNGRFYLAQAETSDTEHTQLLSNNWISAFADLAAVHAYKLTVPALWHPGP